MGTDAHPVKWCYKNDIHSVKDATYVSKVFGTCVLPFAVGLA